MENILLSVWKSSQWRRQFKSLTQLCHQVWSLGLLDNVQGSLHWESWMRSSLSIGFQYGSVWRINYLLLFVSDVLEGGQNRTMITSVWEKDRKKYTQPSVVYSKFKRYRTRTRVLLSWHCRIFFISYWLCPLRAVSPLFSHGSSLQEVLLHHPPWTQLNWTLKNVPTLGSAYLLPLKGWEQRVISCVV